MRKIVLAVVALCAAWAWAGPDVTATNVAAILRDMRADVKTLRMKVGYPGKFLEVPENVKAVRQQKYVRREVPLSRDGELYDVGQESVGYIEAECEEMPELYLGESKAEAMNENAADFEQTNGLVRVGGVWRNPQPLALRYFRFKGKQPGKVRFIEEIADVTNRVPFKGSAREERMHAVALRTLRLCMREFLLDGVKRDRLPWAGDLSVSLLANVFSFREPEIVKRTLTVLDSAGWEAGDVNGIIDYSLWLVICHELFQQHFGDREFLAAKYDRVAGRLESFARRANADGLLEETDAQGREIWLFIDWTDDAHSTVALNAIYYGALQAGVKLAKRMGRAADAARWRDRAANLRATLRAKAWDAQRGLFRYDAKDPTRGHFTRHPNIYAAYFGVAEGDELKSIGAALAGDELPAVGTPYASAYEVMALVGCGRLADARKRLERIWGGMLDLGATTFWEGFDPAHSGAQHWVFYGRPFGNSLCHAWSSAPVFLLPMLAAAERGKIGASCRPGETIDRREVARAGGDDAPTAIWMTSSSPRETLRNIWETLTMWMR